MGLCINFVIRLNNPGNIASFLGAAGAEARRRKWKARRRTAGSMHAAFTPHRDCEDVVLDFASGLVCDGFVKTNYAPRQAHISVVEFFDALRPYAKSLTLDDETGYAKHRNPKKLAVAFAGFADAMSAYSGRLSKRAGKDGRPAGKSASAPVGRPITFTLGALTLGADGQVVQAPGTRVVVQPVSQPNRRKR